MAYRSITTVKADVLRRWFQAEGDGIVWAVVDSGIDGSHPHFRKHANLTLQEPLQHRDFFVRSGDEGPLIDAFGHGTHVAGIIAGEMTASSGPMIVLERTKDTEGNDSVLEKTITSISGMAPKAKLLSLKVLDESGSGSVSSVLAALAYIDELNDHGRRLRIHGVNLSLGYGWDVESFACGQSPLCITVNRLVQTGVLVVVAAGNTGFGYQNSVAQGPVAQGLELSINDPGNAELALTVGSTHRDQPFVYGVSYFSGKGPTVDGRLKPDLVAPGEYVASAVPRAVALKRARTPKADKPAKPGSRTARDVAYYYEDSGTAMATAHVSGVAAAILSLRRDLVGNPGETKSILMNSATDLRRHRYFQGAGLVDALRAVFPAASPVGTVAGGGEPLVAPLTTVQATGGASAQASAPSSARVTLLPCLLPNAPPVPPASVATRPPLRLMISYSHKDEALKDTLITHLSALNRGRLLDVWQDRRILPGAEFGPEIRKQLDEADIIVLLISADFMASEYVNLIELKRAIERHQAGDARVIPVVIRPTDWEGTPMWGLNPLPKDAKAVTTWENLDEAWLNVAKGIRAAVQQMTREQ
jgi:subtilisin family serine protease